MTSDQEAKSVYTFKGIRLLDYQKVVAKYLEFCTHFTSFSKFVYECMEIKFGYKGYIK